MKKRPLCTAVLLLFILLRFLPAGMWMKEPYPGELPQSLTGEIYRIEPWEQGKAIYLRNSNASYAGGVLVYLETKSAYSVGDTIQLRGKITYKNLRPPENPGQFDSRLYYQTRGVVLLCYAKEAKILDSRARSFPKLLEHIRGELGKRCDLLFGEDGAVLKAMFLGEREGLPRETKDLYQKSGISHLLSISGLHVSLVGAGLYRLFRKLGCSYVGAGVPAMGAVLFYGSLTGMGTSTTRAVMMFLLSLGADFLGKSYDMLTSLSVAALLLLLEQPLYARDASFLLSFGAVLGIGLLFPLVRNLFPIRKKWMQGLLISFSVQIFTLPLLLFFYYEIPVYSLALNFFVVPLMSLLMPTGLISLALSFISFSLSAPPAFLCRILLSLFAWLANCSLRLPGAVQILGKPENLSIVLYYLAVTLLILLGPKLSSFRGRAVACCLLALFPLFLVFHPEKGLTFTMLDVGQGESLFLRTDGGATLLIDGGSSDLKGAGERRIIPFLKEEGVRRLDYVAATHTDGDHISGLRELLALSGQPGEVEVGNLLLTASGEESEAGKELKALARERGIPVCRMQAGDRISDGETELFCLYPEADGEYRDTNEASLVLWIEYQSFSMILTGDLGEEGEKRILERGGLKACDILKVGHHGSKNSTCEEWLSALGPKLTLISCGEANSYGHPHPETLSRLKAAKSPALTTMQEGALIVKSDGTNWKVRGFCSGKEWKG